MTLEVPEAAVKTELYVLPSPPRQDAASPAEARPTVLRRACLVLALLAIPSFLASQIADAPLLHSRSTSAQARQDGSTATPAGTPRPAVLARLRPPPDGRPLPARCNLGDVVAILTDFAEAFNRGDEEAVAAMIPAEPGAHLEPAPGRFGWYADRPTWTMAKTRDEMRAIVRERHPLHDTVHVLQVDATGSYWEGGAGFVFDVAREADDIPYRVVGGKGAVDCYNRAIWVWSVGDRATVPDAWFETPVPGAPATPTPFG